MAIPTEPIGSLPRPLALTEAVAAAGDGADPKLDPLYEEAVRDAVERFEATVATDHSRWKSEVTKIRRLLTFQGVIGTNEKALHTQACPRTGPAAGPTP